MSLELCLERRISLEHALRVKEVSPSNTHGLEIAADAVINRLARLILMREMKLHLTFKEMSQVHGLLAKKVGRKRGKCCCCCSRFSALLKVQ